MENKISGLAVFILFAVLSLFLAIGQPASANSPTIKTVRNDISSDSAKLVGAVSECSLGNGFAGIRESADEGRIFLAWVGEVDPATQKIIDGLSTPVVVTQSRHTQCEIEKEARAISSAFASNHNIISYPSNDGEAIDVEINLFDGESIAELQQKMSDEIGNTIPVRIVSTSPSEGTSFASRQTDSTPWSGGSGYKIVAPNTVFYCSTGAGVWSDANNSPYLLTASHCVENFANTVNILRGDLSAVVGYTDMANPGFYRVANDVALIKPNSNDVSQNTFIGGINSSAAIPIWSSQASWVGQVICTSGANTGEHCLLGPGAGFTVTKVGVSMAFGGIVRQSLVEAQGSSILAGEGDSGGAVYYYNGSTGHYYLSGTITGGDLNPPFSVPCGAVYFGTPSCSRKIWFAPASSSLSALHVHLSH